MTRAALIDAAGVVANIIVIDDGYSPPEGLTLWTDDPLPRIGDMLVDGEIVPVEAPSAPVQPVRITRLRLKNELLTPAELLAYNKAKRDVAALTAADYGNPAKALLVQAEILLDYMEDATAIELDNPKTIMGVSQLMVALGILTPARAAQVLANEEP